MKLLHVTPYADPVYGGPCVALRAMAEAASNHGIEVEVVTTNAAGDKNLPLDDGVVLRNKGVAYHFFRRQFPRSWFCAPGLDRWLAEHVMEYDVIHLHVPFTAPFGAAARKARSAGVPYVVTPHGLLDPWSLRQKAWKKVPYLQFWERDNLARSSVIHATAPAEESFINALGLGPPVRCLPLAVRVPPVTTDPDFLSGPSRILCISRLHPVKALPVVFDALAQLRAQGRDFVLDLAGGGDAHYVAKLRRRLKDLGLSDSVVWHGHIGEERKSELYATASCFIQLSHHENFGLAIAEALAAGLPVVVSDQVGIAPDVEAFRAGKVVAVGDARGAAEAIEGLTEPNVAGGYRERARKLATERYGQDSFASGLVELYESVICR